MLSEPMLVARLEQVALLEQSIAWTKDWIENGDWDEDELDDAHKSYAQLTAEMDELFIQSVW